MKKPAFALLASCLLLSACLPMSREAKDEKISRACHSAVTAVYGPQDTVEMKDATYADAQSHDGTPLRATTIKAYYTRDRGIIEERSYTCAFEEKDNLFGWQAAFYRMEMDGMKFGNFDGTIHGEVNDLLRINEAVESVL